jgi:hypothetical protein
MSYNHAATAMTLTHYCDGQPTRSWRVNTRKEAAEIVRRQRGTLTPPRFRQVPWGWELPDGDGAIYEISAAATR